MDQPSTLMTGLLGDVGKGAVAVVVVEDGAAVAGDEQVGVAVVVVVGGGDGDAVEVGRDAGLARLRR